MSDKELAGKVAIVTGAGRNIGRAIALPAGRRRRVGGGERAHRTRPKPTPSSPRSKRPAARPSPSLADVADAAAVDAMAQAALKAFGRIDILVNNAALRREKPIGEMSYAEWREVMDVTLDSRVSRRARPACRR